MRPIEDPKDDLSVTPPKSWAAGLPGVAHALEYSLSQTSPRRTALTLLNLKHVNDEATSRRVTREFFAEHSVAELDKMSDYWLNQQGRLTEPMVKLPSSA